MEKFFSAVAEMEDGTKKLVPARAESPGAAYQQVKKTPGVRRVGKVTEVTRADYAEILAGRAPVPGRSAGTGDPKRPTPRHSEPPESGAAGEPGGAGRSERWAGHTITGPRVVLHAKPSGGEQPFKHLKAPPERPKPPAPPQPVKPVPAPAVAKPVVTAPPAAAPAPAPKPTTQPAAAPPAVAQPVEAQPDVHEYRIVKSRRQVGEPYLLQRGTWGQQKGKRAFMVDWEKGFARREDAERHLEWVHRSAREMEELNQQDDAEQEEAELEQDEQAVPEHAGHAEHA